MAYRVGRRIFGPVAEYNESASVLLFCLGTIAACVNAPDGPLTFQYRMSGEVRLLFFWKSREGVGGGHIRISRQSGSEEIEVLFGCDPARVPGRVNRWGFGRERSVLPPAGAAFSFDGLMSYSPEKTLQQARSATREPKAGSYYAIQSEARGGRAVSAVRFVQLRETLDYRSGASIIAPLWATLSARPPDRRRELVTAGSPLGFLATLYALTRNIQSGVRSAPFVFDARLYQLNILRVKLARDSASADFAIHNIDKGTDTTFALEFPTTGPRAGIPTKIVLQPRWWLRLRLDLVDSVEGDN